jgi:hypothetical protein
MATAPWKSPPMKVIHARVVYEVRIKKGKIQHIIDPTVIVQEPNKYPFKSR